MNDQDLSFALQNVERGSVSEIELSGIIHHAIADASAILLSRFRRYLPILRDAGYSLEAAASRCIEELVLPRDGKSCYRLAEYLSEHCTAESTEDQHSRAFRRVIYLQISQQLPELLGEFDSPYKRILRLVSKCLNHNPAMIKLEGFLEDHYYRGDETRLLLERAQIPLDTAVGELFVRTTDVDHVGQLVAHIFDILDDQNEYRRTLTTGDLVEIIRDFHAMRWEQSNVTHENNLHFEAGDRDRILTPTLEAVRRTVVQSYLEKNVLDEDSAQKYLRAVSSMLADLSTNDTLSWYIYYEREFNGQSYENYRAAERSRFEYVMGLAKKKFISRCKEYFSD